MADTELPSRSLEDKPHVRAPRVEQVRRILKRAELEDTRIAVALRLVAATGMRRGEVCAVRWSDLDRAAGTLRVDESVVKSSGTGAATGRRAVGGPHGRRQRQRFVRRHHGPGTANVGPSARGGGEGALDFGGVVPGGVDAPAVNGQLDRRADQGDGDGRPRQYYRFITCTDANGVQTDLPTSEPFEGFFPVMPRLGAAISCTATNTPIPPELELDKALGSDRFHPGDQFTVQIRTEGSSGPW